MMVAIIILCDLVLQLEELCGALWVRHGCTLAKLTDDSLESVLVHSLLLVKVVGGALEAEIMITGQDEHVFGLSMAFGARYVFLVIRAQLIIREHVVIFCAVLVVVWRLLLVLLLSIVIRLLALLVSHFFNFQIQI